MKLFGDKPQELAMRTLIHDTNAAFGGFHHLIREVENSILKKQFENQVKKVENVIDEYYKKFEKDFQ